jgi:signal transduction histidine kinase
LRDATYLGALVENLETETRVKGRALAEVQVDLCELVGGAIARAQAVGAQYGAEVDGAVPDEPVVRTTDPIALGRALSNLTENAVRHGARHVAVTLRVDAGAFCIEVRDDSGADPASFRRGRGLGIASTICEALALELRMVSESGELVASIRETPEGSSHGNET